MPISYQEIQPAYQAPGGNLALLDAFDAMAEMEQQVLGFLDPTYGLQYSYGGTVLPEKLPGVYPTVLHLPNGAAQLVSLNTMGQHALIAHPGGARHHVYPFQILWIVGERVEHIERLIAKTLFWSKAVDMAYAANGTLQGQVKEIGLHAATWAEFSYGGSDKEYFGWSFQGRVRLQYIMQGGG